MFGGHVGANGGACSTVVITANHWYGSIDNADVTIGGISTVRPSVGARLRMRTGRGCTRLTVFLASTVYSATYPTFASPGVLVDGIWREALTVATNDAQIARSVSLDGEPHLVEIAAPYQEVNTSLEDIKCTCVTDVSAFGGTLDIVA